TSTMAGELVYDLNRINASFVFVEDRRHAEKILAHREDLTGVRRVIFVDPTGMTIYKDDPWLLSFNQLLEMGKGLEQEDPDLFNRELWLGRPEDTAMMIMTSGTRGIPRPALISHKNLTAMSEKWLDNLPLSIDDTWVSLPPTAGLIEETWCVGIALALGMTINFPETSRSLINDMREIGPSVLVNYPGFWEQLMANIKTEIEKSGPIRRWLFDHAFNTGRAVYERESEGNSAPFWLRCLKRLFSRIISMPLLDRTGLLNVRHAYSGGCPISPEVIKFFRFYGLALKQCYGLAETAGMIQFQCDDDMSPDTIGLTLPGTDIRIAHDGEITVSGEFVFSGYYQDNEAIYEVLKDGRLYTGDIGSLDESGRVSIAGRKEDIIIPEDGRIFSRDFIETRLKENPFIKEAVIWGKDMPYLIAFIGIDYENTMRWAKRHDIICHDYAELTGHPVIEELIKNKVRDLNQRLADYMRIRKFALINKELDTDEELTKTGVARRKFIFEQYMDILKAMYTNEPVASLPVRLKGPNDDIRTINARIRIITVDEGGPADYE
ncbi:MAG: AMP-binding protein, partial [Deltaproteobacteria bacterium]|nr:AMP-binding protein [Deltaproteobacteria bacterium]